MGATRFRLKNKRYDVVLVSILAHPEGWALPRAILAVVIASQQVSILAHPEGWALPGHCWTTAAGRLFQSSPIPKDGRYTVKGIEQPPLFQVSILAHPEGWALQRG